jgi:DNA ligase-1
MSLLLAENWTPEIDPVGWWLSEKLDGVRAYWTGDRLLTRTGKLIHAPFWWLQGFPKTALDGELWLDRKRFDEVRAIAQRHNAGEAWRPVHYVCFDLPELNLPFEQRMDRLASLEGPAHLTRVAQFRVGSRAELDGAVRWMSDHGGEGVMLRQSGSFYERGRSATLLKVKPWLRAEATVTGHVPGRGRYDSVAGSLAAVLDSGVAFAVGSGLTDALRESPPPSGTRIVIEYQELTPYGCPRNPVFRGIVSGVQTVHF